MFFISFLDYIVYAPVVYSTINYVLYGVTALLFTAILIAIVAVIVFRIVSTRNRRRQWLKMQINQNGACEKPPEVKDQDYKEEMESCLTPVETNESSKID